MSDLERIAIVETKVENLEDQHKELLKLLHEIKDEMTRYKGFLGGVAFLVSCLVVAVSIFKEWILKHI
jgi:uncharacterized membrane protein YjjP (DUF1212 family)